MQGTVSRRLQEIFQAVSNLGIISQLQVIPHNQRQATHIGIFFGATNESHVKITSRVRAFDSAANSPMHPMVNPATYSGQFASTMPGMIYSATLTSKGLGMKVFSEPVRYVQLNIFTQAEQR